MTVQYTVTSTATLANGSTTGVSAPSTLTTPLAKYASRVYLLE